MIEFELQSKLDIEKWLESESKGKDMCGSYEYCAYCQNEPEFPCANAYMRWSNVITKKEEKTAEQPVVKEKKAAAKKETAKAAKPAKKAEKTNNDLEEKTKMETNAKKKSKTLTFEEKLAMADDSVKAIYNDIVEALDDKRVKNRITKTSHNFTVKKVPVAKIRIMKKGLQMYLALDPNDENFAKYPHKDVSDKKTYEKTPFMFKVSSNLSVKRAKELIAEILK